MAFSQGLRALGIRVGNRRLRKMAWQRLARLPLSHGNWDGLMPTKERTLGTWHEYLDAIKRPGAWASDLELEVLAFKSM